MQTMSVKEIKSKLTVDDCKNIMALLGADIVKENDEYIIYPTGDHHLDWNDGSPKLYFYKNTLSFFSYTTSAAYDIIGIIQARWELEGYSFSFNDIIQYIMTTVGLSKDEYNPQGSTTQPQWKKLVQRYTKPKKHVYQGRIYSKDELSLCLPIYHTMFLNDGISKETMQKFQIGYYPPSKQITIPVFSECGNLIGVHCRNTAKHMLDRGYKYLPLRTCSTHYKFKTGSALYGIHINKPHIQTAKQVLLFESPKSVLQTSTMGIQNSLALFGMNLSQCQRDIILSCGVNEVVICLDKEYHEPYDDDWEVYANKVVKIANVFKGYAKVTACADMNGLLDYKDSPSDKGHEVFMELYNSRFDVI